MIHYFEKDPFLCFPEVAHEGMYISAYQEFMDEIIQIRNYLYPFWFNCQLPFTGVGGRATPFL